jgi:hypothetical protein
VELVLPHSDSREISRVLVLNPSGKPSAARAPPRISVPLTEPSLFIEQHPKLDALPAPAATDEVCRILT